MSCLCCRVRVGRYTPVSYTHLDVYKRQAIVRPRVSLQIRQETGREKPTKLLMETEDPFRRQLISVVKWID